MSTRKDPCPICGAAVTKGWRMQKHLEKHKRVDGGAHPATAIKTVASGRLAKS